MRFAGKQSAEKWADIIREAKLLRSINHENVIRLIFIHDTKQ